MITLKLFDEEKFVSLNPFKINRFEHPQEIVRFVEHCHGVVRELALDLGIELGHALLCLRLDRSQLLRLDRKDAPADPRDVRMKTHELIRLQVLPCFVVVGVVNVLVLLALPLPTVLHPPQSPFAR